MLTNTAAARRGNSNTSTQHSTIDNATRVAATAASKGEKSNI